MLTPHRIVRRPGGSFVQPLGWLVRRSLAGPLVAVILSPGVAAAMSFPPRSTVTMDVDEERFCLVHPEPARGACDGFPSVTAAKLREGLAAPGSEVLGIAASDRESGAPVVIVFAERPWPGTVPQQAHVEQLAQELLVGLSPASAPSVALHGSDRDPFGFYADIQVESRVAHSSTFLAWRAYFARDRLHLVALASAASKETAQKSFAALLGTLRPTKAYRPARAESAVAHLGSFVPCAVLVGAVALVVMWRLRRRLE